MNEFWTWVTNVISGFASAWTWFTTPLNSELDGLLGIVTTPIALISFTGLVGYISYAVVRWLIV